MHRNPWKLADSDEIEFEPEGSHHTQIAGLASLEGEYEMIFVGSNNDFPHSTQVSKQLWQQKKSVLVNVEPTLAKGHYEGYCKSSLKLV